MVLCTHGAGDDWKHGLWSGVERVRDIWISTEQDDGTLNGARAFIACIGSGVFCVEEATIELIIPRTGHET